MIENTRDFGYFWVVLALYGPPMFCLGSGDLAVFWATRDWVQVAGSKDYNFFKKLTSGFKNGKIILRRAILAICRSCLPLYFYHRSSFKNERIIENKALFAGLCCQVVPAVYGLPGP